MPTSATIRSGTTGGSKGRRSSGTSAATRTCTSGCTSPTAPTCRSTPKADSLPETTMRVLTLAAAALFAAPLAAADGPTIDKLFFGNVLVGKSVEKADLKGKVVLVEMWGVH